MDADGGLLERGAVTTAAAAADRAQLAEFRSDRHGANGHYRSAPALHDEVDLPVEHCETLLAYGGFLRRAGQATRARPVLAQAAEAAQKTGALSPQEERAVALAATGAANADIAGQLCLSVSTVETHLEHIYTKLGIHTRYQLIAMAAGHQPGRKETGASPTPDRPRPATLTRTHMRTGQ